MDLSFDLSNILGLSATIAVLAGILLVIVKKRLGFILCSAGNVAWLVSELRNEVVDFWFLITCVIFTLINIYGWFRWKGQKECGNCTLVKKTVNDIIGHIDIASDKLKELRE